MAQSDNPFSFTDRSTPLDVLGLTARAHNALRRSGIHTVQQVIPLTDVELRRVRNFGTKALQELREKLAAYLDEHPEFHRFEARKDAEPKQEPPSLLSSLPIAPERLESLDDIPLDTISVDRLGLAPPDMEEFSFYGVESVGDLVREPASAFPLDSPTIKRLARYLNWLVDQDEKTWRDEADGVGLSPLYQAALPEVTLDALIDSLLSSLRDREREILQCRLGYDGCKMTWKQIGKRMGVTRERIRQIQSYTLRKLCGLGPRHTIAPFIQPLVHAFDVAGGLMTEGEIQAYLNSLLRVETINVAWAAHLLMTINDTFQKVTNDGLWGLASAPLGFISSIQQTLVDVLGNIGGLASQDQLVTHFTQTTFHQQQGRNYTIAFISACIRTHPKIELVEGMYGLRDSCRQFPSAAEMARIAQEEQKIVLQPAAEEEPAPPPAPPKPVKPKKKLVIDLDGVQPLDRPPATLDEWERYLRSRIGQVELLGEIPINNQERIQLGKVVGLRVAVLGHGRAVSALRSNHPCALAVYLVAQGIYGYQGGDYWTDVVKVTGFSHPRVSRIGQAFEDTLEALGLPLFFDMRDEAHRYISLILAHGGIPNYCLPDFFANMLQPAVVRAQYADMSAAELIDEWRWRSSVTQFTDKPVIRFLIYGGRVAEDFVDRCREMAWTYIDAGVMPGPEDVGLPQRVVAAYDAWITQQGADQVARDAGDRWRLRKPQVLVDPWGEGIVIDLPPQQVPATEVYADIKWQVKAGDETKHIPVHVRRVGFDRRTEAEALPLTHPAETIEVSLLVKEEVKRTWRFQGIDENHPLLAFDPAKGTLLPWTHSLPAGHLGILYPADFELRVEGDGHLIETLPRMPWGWSSFRGERWDLTHAAQLILLREGKSILEVPLRSDETARSPSLESGDPLSLGGSEERAPVYVGTPPSIRVPLTGRQKLDEELARWRLTVHNKWSAVPEVNVSVALAELKADLTITPQYVELPLSLPSLLGEMPYGNFTVRLRGPLGRDAEFTLRILPHFAVCGHEDLYLPAVQDGPPPVTLLVEALPGDRLDSSNEEAACQVQVVDQGETAWQHEVTVGPNVTEVKLTVVHPHPSGEAVHVPIRVPIRRLRWALVDEDTASRHDVWTGQVIKRPIEALRQLRSPFLLVKLPLMDGDDVQVGVRLLDISGDELQVADRIALSAHCSMGRFDLGAFMDTIRASRSPILRLELTVWGLPGQDDPLRLTVLSLTQTLLVENAHLAFRVVDRRVFFDLTWDEPVPLKNRHVRFWPLWRPWDPFFEQSIPDEAEGSLSFPVPPGRLKSGKYRLEFLVIDPWAPVEGKPQLPKPGTPSTADVKMIEADRQLEILDGRLQKQGASFELHLERAAVYQDTDATEKAAPDRHWCYEHLDEGIIPLKLALLDVVKAAGDAALTRSLQLKLFAARRVEDLLAMHAAGEVSTDHFEAYLANMPRSGMLPVATCERLLGVEDETVRLYSAQQLIHRANRSGPEAVCRWVTDAQISDADAVALLALNAEFSADVLKDDLSNPIAARLLRTLAPELGDKTPVVQPGTWAYTRAGWGRIDRIEGLDGAPVQQFLTGETDYRLYVTLRPAVDAEPVVVDLKKRLITFTKAEVIYTCDKCEGFSARDPYLIVEKHNTVAHGGTSPAYGPEKMTKRTLKGIVYSARPPAKQGLGIPESAQ